MKLSGAGALGASHFGFDALDRVLYPELSDELLDAAAEGAREEALLPRRGRGGEVAVAIDLGHAVECVWGLKVISPEFGKVDAQIAPGGEPPITNACLVADRELLRHEPRTASCC